ncbi:polar growth protein [Ophidiomyces ophidiicola]|uniref:polar growth protein n=1 Tax=Ophidiomyces ophidiicola TaxID=1387563 RepID=UPI0020C3EA23|nr:polar growth protein [Ophidiomyces ophidiicola]KAI1947323.1 polar growth protein [Ophidiomyces ophidiicola]KAI1951842.1 polar growth protein [Ophidiomyces ophidiicola]KAI1973563.1 polar growth protein [Ophidiomyces ophidiicola]KAI1984447.1 polar growth protein [Ophidiomyces ophidiicola]KAI1990206.1 polar growth protein [Ophidiomyces ophidiicola]
MSKPSEAPRGAQPGDLLLVVHNFDARGADELTLRRGDKVELLELDDGFGDGWYLGRHVVENRTGLFPGVYTTADTTSQPSLGKTAALSASQTSAIEQFESPQHGSETVSSILTNNTNPQVSRLAGGSEPSPPVSTEPNNEKETLPIQPLSRNASTSTARAPEIQRTINQTIVPHLSGEDSPVLSETLSVIDEHITNFSTPRQSVIAQELHRGVNDSSSEYSSHGGNRLSYIHGTETDEEEGRIPTEADVRRWDHQQVSNHLTELGVDPRHCKIFKEQEITGDVLLEMDQEFIYMKDFDFGVMGRRLKTWHIIKAFQEETKGIGQPRQSTSTYSGRVASPVEHDRSQSRAVTASSFLPRIPSVGEARGPVTRQSRGATFSGYQGKAPPSPIPTTSFSRPRTRDSASRPSPDFIRQSNYHQRHSSIDEVSKSAGPTKTNPVGAAHPKMALANGRSSPFERPWPRKAATDSRPSTALGTTTTQNQGLPIPNRHTTIPGGIVADGSPEFDRGYFSGGEVDSRKSRNVLRKRESEGRSLSQSRQSSTADDAKLRNYKRHSRFSSVDSLKEFAPYLAFGKLGSPPAAAQRHEFVEDKSHSPPVTNLEQSSHTTGGFFSSLSSLNSKLQEDNSGHPSPLPSNSKSVGPKFRRTIGLRAISDAVTGNEKAQLASSASSPGKDYPKSPARTNSATPSGTSKSSEIEATDPLSSRPSEAGISLLAPKTPSHRGKSKRDTSAYIRGLEKKSPQEQIIGCDYYGWMKKKSSNLMATWKPRLFVLRGRRLSYYYSEDDTEERGLIDISSHRVFRADNDTITSFHATITGAKASPTSPTNSNHSKPISPNQDQEPEKVRRKSGSDEQPFIFKLVPPKNGLPRAVQFTKPAVHYFQVDTLQQGRLWMAALMKATIERDLNLPVKTTNKQKTVSLKQARSMNQRPPALMNSSSNTELRTSADQKDPQSSEDNLTPLPEGMTFEAIEGINSSYLDSSSSRSFST